MRKLSGCEREALAVIMDMQQAIGLREIQEEVNRRFNREWEPQTASTVIGRMVKKRIFNIRTERTLRDIQDDNSAGRISQAGAAECRQSVL